MDSNDDEVCPGCSLVGCGVDVVDALLISVAVSKSTSESVICSCVDLDVDDDDIPSHS